jgi:SAM-dependent methyltransferase
MTQDLTAPEAATPLTLDRADGRPKVGGLVDYDRIPIADEEDPFALHAAHELYERLIGLWAPALIEAAHDLDVFAELAHGPAAASGVSAALGTDLQATRVLLDALHAYGLLDRSGTERDGHRYHLPPHIAECTTAGGRLSLVGKFLHDRHVAWPAWRRLAETVRHGAHQAGGGWSENQISTDDYRALARGISFWAPPIIELLSTELGRRGWAADERRALLDIGCGAGAYAHLLLRRFPEWSGTGLDAGPIAAIAEESAIELGLADRFTAQVGDFWADPWPARQDLILFGNIFHLQPRGRAQELARLAAGSLAPGGLVCIIDQIRLDEGERSTPQDRFALLFAASMLATGGGDTYRVEAYDRWLEQAGLQRVGLLDAPMHRILLAEHRPL